MVLLHLTQPHLGPAKQGGEEKKKTGERNENEPDCPEKRKGKAGAAFSTTTTWRQPGMSLGTAASAGLSELGMGRACFGQANRDLAG